MMSIDSRALEIVEDALGMDDPDAVAAFLGQACDDDIFLRAKVDRMLALDQTGFKLMRTDAHVPSTLTTDPLPDRIGPFRVLGTIGRGGMGAVVKAERDDGLFEQVVAIKLIRLDLADTPARERFAQERRILGRLVHPGIARILDGGDHEGRPYLVMDFVDGMPVTTALAARKAPIDDTLEAFEAVCDAVAYAHRNLIVHADIKPSNVTMTADGIVKLLDFGISRLIVDLDSSETADPYPLTKGYAAPERVGGGQPTITGDVYSLGVLLHEMLTGILPQQSTVMSLTAENVRISPKQLRGDLDAIVAKALAQDEADRYPDVASLVGDIRYYRNNVPVAARQNAGLVYRPLKFIRRHRTGFALTAAAMTSLIVATAVSTTQYIRAERARTEADARFADARGTARYLLFDLLPKLENQPNALPLRAEMAGVAQHYLDRLSGARQASNAVKLEAATGLWRLAQHQAKAGRPNLGQTERADANLRKAETIAVSLSGDPARVLLARIRLDRVWMATAMQADAVGADRLSIITKRSIAAAQRLDPQLEPDYLFVMADLRNWQGRFAEARRFANSALARRGNDESRQGLLDRARLMNIRAEATYYDGHPDQAEHLYRQGLGLIERAYARWPNDNYILYRRAFSRWELGTTLLDLKRPDEALSLLRQGQHDAEQIYAFDRSDKEARRMVRVLTTAHAQTLGFLGRYGDALPILMSVMAIDRKALHVDPRNPRLARDFAYDLTTIGEVLSNAGHRAQACAQDRATMTFYDVLDSKHLLMKIDAANNIKLVNARIQINC